MTHESRNGTRGVLAKATDSMQASRGSKGKHRRISTTVRDVHVPPQAARGPSEHLFRRAAGSVRACKANASWAKKKRTMGSKRASKATQNGDDTVKALGGGGQQSGPDEHSNITCEKVSGGQWRGGNEHKARTHRKTDQQKAEAAANKTQDATASKLEGPHNLR